MLLKEYQNEKYFTLILQTLEYSPKRIGAKESQNIGILKESTQQYILQKNIKPRRMSLFKNENLLSEEL